MKKQKPCGLVLVWCAGPFQARSQSVGAVDATGTARLRASSLDLATHVQSVPRHRRPLDALGSVCVRAPRVSIRDGLPAVLSCAHLTVVVLMSVKGTVSTGV